MNNPFEEIEGRLSNIEALLENLLKKPPANHELQQDEVGDINLAVAVTKLKKATIYSHVFKHKIPFRKKLGKLYFHKKELLDWIDGTEEEPAAKDMRPLFPRHNKSTKYKI